MNNFTLLLRSIPFFIAMIWLPIAGQAQTTAIPDVNFEQKLIDLGIDNNGLNGNILNSDAAMVTILDLGNSNISDLTCIEAFTALTAFSCSSNALTSLDVSNNTALTVLECSNNALTSLDMRNIPLQNIIFFQAIFNPNLSCISVDNPDAVPLKISDNVEADVIFSTDCPPPESCAMYTVTPANCVLTSQSAEWGLNFDGQDDFIQSQSTDALKKFPLTIEA